MNPAKWLKLQRKVKFGDCDSANVIHFNKLLQWSHEAWEESMQIYGIPLNSIFPKPFSKNNLVFPVVKCQAYFFKPISNGDLLSIEIVPSKINNHSFMVETYFLKDLIKVAEGKIIHFSIDAETRAKMPLNEYLEKWIEASNIGNRIKECR
tara:strand:+ start:1033 stop:1485 length:453 start_codon:yes stop_codon:yes gene_type:complete